MKSKECKQSITVSSSTLDLQNVECNPNSHKIFK